MASCSLLLRTFLLALALVSFCYAIDDYANYMIGRGMYDMTGPAGEINFMGYANPEQLGAGIHLRQFARAFIIRDPKEGKSTVFVSIDACMASQVVTIEVLQGLANIYGSLYTRDNVLISGTHTHSAPGGFFQYVLFDITTTGTVKQTIDVYVNGILKAIQIAHDNVQPGYILMNSGLLLNASRNRSPTSYLSNPAPERAQYDHDTDKLMTVLKLLDQNGEDLGMINWFAVHCTSMNNTNKLISSDNKGYASLLFEEEMDPDVFPGQGQFVAAFAQSNLGDVSPNTRGAHCMDTGLPCDSNHSTCHGRNEMCVASGPGKDMKDSTHIIATLQYKRAKELYDSAKLKIEGPIDFRHSYVRMSNQTVEFQGETVHTCKPAMGYSFAAGTTDGPGAFDFTQGMQKGNKFWDLVSAILAKPSKQQIACHHPKPILLDTGSFVFPFAWQPEIVDIQLVRIGQVLIAAVPGEFTTMSGRRLRNAIKKQVVDLGWSADMTVVVAGLSGTYSDYIATYEEYQDQRYEAASTIFGPHTLAAYIQNFERLATDMVKGTHSTSDPSPGLDESAIHTYDFTLPVVWDTAPPGSHLGGIIKDTDSTYKAGESVSVEFHAGNPRNNLMTNDTFLTVEKLMQGNVWKVILKDTSWHTEFHWSKTTALSSESTARIVWNTTPSTPAGTYRLRHFGYYRPLTRSPKPYQGTSRSFKIL